MPKPVIYSKSATDFTIKPCQNKVQNFYKASSQPSVCKNSCLQKTGEAQQRKIRTVPDRTLKGVCHTWFSPVLNASTHHRNSAYNSLYYSAVYILQYLVFTNKCNTLNARGIAHQTVIEVSGQGQSLEMKISVRVLGRSQYILTSLDAH